MLAESPMASKFRSMMIKKKDARISDEAQFNVAYPTGFLGFDFLNGSIIHVKGNEMDFKYNSVGIIDGSANTVIGRSGCGKTTFELQIIGNVIRRFKTSMAFIDIIEAGYSSSNIEKLLQMASDELKGRVVMRDTGITTENVYIRLRAIHDMKLEDPETFTYDTGLFDTSGNRIYKFEPTFYMLDSIAMLMPDNLAEEDELGGQMGATSMAKKNTQLFKAIVPLLKKANIIMLCINHILDDVDINPMAKKKSQNAYLKQGERLPGGKAALYLANNMIRLDDTVKLKPTEGFGIYGSIVECTIIKSRTNKSGVSIPLIFHDGKFDPDLSLFQLLKANNKVNGAGAYLYLGDRSDIKFSQKQFLEKLKSNPELQEVFMQECYEVLESLLSKEYIPIPDEDNIVDISQRILAMGMGQAS